MSRMSRISKTSKNDNYILYYHLAITLVFIYIFIQFLTMKRSNLIYRIYADYIMNKYCLILYILLIMFIVRIDSYTGVLLFILVMVPFRFVYKEFFEDTTTIPNTIPSTIPNTIPVTTNNALLDKELLGIDDRFKMDDVAKDQILKQIRSQIEFDPYKTNLSKDVIYEIYNKYFDNDIFVKLKNVNDDSKQYIASGNFNYLPKNDKVDYDLVSYQNLSQNTQLGINPIIDGLNNNTKSR
uniref:Uncharacterized protein n=1 Tax=viral metagenome TaxID=1070528 RepID=A0A6C0EYF7_9ZZZZ